MSMEYREDEITVRGRKALSMLLDDLYSRGCEIIEIEKHLERVGWERKEIVTPKVKTVRRPVFRTKWVKERGKWIRKRVIEWIIERRLVYETKVVRIPLYETFYTVRFKCPIGIKRIKWRKTWYLAFRGTKRPNKPKKSPDRDLELSITVDRPYMLHEISPNYIKKIFVMGCNLRVFDESSWYPMIEGDVKDIYISEDTDLKVVIEYFDKDYPHNSFEDGFRINTVIDEETGEKKTPYDISVMTDKERTEWIWRLKGEIIREVDSIIDRQFGW